MFVYTQLLESVVDDLAKRIQMFEAIDTSRILIVGANRTTNGRSGALAECMALGMPEKPAIEFRYDPRSRRVTGATPWFIPKNRRVMIDGRRMLYVLRFRLPRFLAYNPVHSVIHELLHISDKCDGTHRTLRHGAWFERYVRMIERDWRRNGDQHLVQMMDMSYRDLQREYGSLICRCFKEPFHTPWRLPCLEQPSLAEHPEVARLELKFGPGPVRRLPFKFDDVEQLRLTEKNLEYRIFTPQGSERISDILLPASTRNGRNWHRPRAFVLD